MDYLCICRPSSTVRSAGFESASSYTIDFGPQPHNNVPQPEPQPRYVPQPVRQAPPEDNGSL